MKPFLLMLLLVVTTSNLCLSQAKRKKPVPAANPEIVTNATVIDLSKAGLGNELIISKIQSSQTNFDLTSTGLIALKNQKIDNEIIKAMLSKGSDNIVKNAIPKPLQSNATGNAKGLSGLTAGIYYTDATSNNPLLLEPNIFTTAKMGNGVLTAVTYGLSKTKYKAVLTGEQAKIHLSGNVVFYFVFGDSFENGATSPNEFLLIKFKPTKKNREVITGSLGLSGITTAISDENKLAFQSVKVSTGVYKIMFDTPIPTGEYGFLYAGGTTSATSGSAPSARTYDFSIQ